MVYDDRAIGVFFLEWLSSANYVIVSSSGSTGPAKTLRIHKNHMVNSALATGEFLNLQENQRALLCLSCDFIAGKMMLVRAMVLGLDLYCYPPTSKPIHKNTSTFQFSALVPLQLKNSLENLRQLGITLVGGASVSPVLQKQLAQLTGEIYETYGMTETVTHIAMRRLASLEQDGDTYFKTLPHVEVEADKNSCLIIHAPYITDKTIYTKDIVEIIDKTTFKWLGRIDNVVNSGGIKLYPEQLEQRLSGFLPNRFFFIGMPDPILGEKLVMLVEGDLDEEELKNKIKKSKLLGVYERPKQIKKIPKFIETGSGKIDRIKTSANL